MQKPYRIRKSIKNMCIEIFLTDMKDFQHNVWTKLTCEKITEQSLCWPKGTTSTSAKSSPFNSTQYSYSSNSGSTDLTHIWNKFLCAQITICVWSIWSISLTWRWYVPRFQHDFKLPTKLAAKIALVLDQLEVLILDQSKNQVPLQIFQNHVSFYQILFSHVQIWI